MDCNLTKLEMLAREYNNNENKIEIKKNELMSRHTTFRIGGSAALYLIPQDTAVLAKLCGFIKDTGVKYYILGNGSNLLFDDAGYDGAVISTSALSASVSAVTGSAITAEAGAPLMTVCKKSRDAGLSGMEFAYGIPGSVGGAVYMNAGAYDGEISGIIKESTYLDPTTLTIQTIPQEAHKYGYRDSVYKHNDHIILSAVFELQRGNIDEISRKMDDYIRRRISKQPLEFPSAGSVFKRYPGRFTGQMIQEAGLKGYAIGGAQVSERHAGFIINRGGATSYDVLKLIEHIKKTILEQFGCELECEIIYVK